MKFPSDVDDDRRPGGRPERRREENGGAVGGEVTNDDDGDDGRGDDHEQKQHRKERQKRISGGADGREETMQWQRQQRRRQEHSDTDDRSEIIGGTVREERREQPWQRQQRHPEQQWKRQRKRDENSARALIEHWEERSGGGHSTSTDGRPSGAPVGTDCGSSSGPDHGSHDYSGSGLTGGFTTITNLDEGRHHEGGNQNKAARSNFNFVGGTKRSTAETDSLPSDGAGGSGGGGGGGSRGTGGSRTFESYYDMQRNGPFIADTDVRQNEIFKIPSIDEDERADDPEKFGGFCDHAEYGNVDSKAGATDDRAGSSLSSITHDFFPRFDPRGRFTNYGKRKPKTADDDGIGPSPSKDNSSKSKFSGRSNPQSPSVRKVDRFFRSQRNNLAGGSSSPWYSISRIQLQPHHHHAVSGDSPPGRPIILGSNKSPPEGSKHSPPVGQIQQGNHQGQLHPNSPNEESPITGDHPPQKISPNNANNDRGIIDDGLNPPPDSVAIRPPREIQVITKFPSPLPHDIFRLQSSGDAPSVISSNFSQLFTNELRERYRRHARISYGRHYRRFVRGSHRKPACSSSWWWPR